MEQKEEADKKHKDDGIDWARDLWEIYDDDTHPKDCVCRVCFQKKL